MRMEMSLPRELEAAKSRRLPLCIPVGVMEYHANHCALGTDTIIPMELLRLFEQERDIVVAPPCMVWPGHLQRRRPRKEFHQCGLGRIFPLHALHPKGIAGRRMEKHLHPHHTPDGGMQPDRNRLHERGQETGLQLYRGNPRQRMVGKQPGRRRGLPVGLVPCDVGDAPFAWRADAPGSCGLP